MRVVVVSGGCRASFFPRGQLARHLAAEVGSEDSTVRVAQATGRKNFEKISQNVLLGMRKC
jgi:hypothetical protein